MKLCPQCAFIYEDHQRFCDMDGKELVHDPASVAEERIVSPPTRMTIGLPARSETLPARPRSRRFPVLVTVGVVLATLLVVIYFAQLHRSPSSNAAHSPIQSPARSATPDSSRQPSPADLVSSTSVAVTPLPEQQSSEQSPEESLSSLASAAAAGPVSPFPEASQSRSSAASVARARLASSPVSAGALTANSRGRVIVRLTNGATISADEVWERRDGIWYRQAGMVTFLKRSRVKTIQRLAPPQPQPAANTGVEKRRKPETNSAQNQLRIRRLEAVDTKKQSRVSSFLKMTGRILKKPFKL